MRDAILGHFSELETWFTHWSIAQDKVREIRDKVLRELDGVPEVVVEEPKQEPIPEIVPKKRRRQGIRTKMSHEELKAHDHAKKRAWYLRNKDKHLAYKRELYKKRVENDPEWYERRKVEWRENYKRRKQNAA